VQEQATAAEEGGEDVDPRELLDALTEEADN
jgi:hypothetical protein